MNVIGWATWYDNNRIFTSEDAVWEDLPDDGIQAIVLFQDDSSKNVINGYDYYFKVGDIFGGNNDNPRDTAKRYPGAVIKRGRWTTTEEIHRINSEVLASQWL